MTTPEDPPMHARIIAPLPSPAPDSDRSRTIATGDAFAARLALAELIVHHGNEPPLHRHHHEDLVVYVVDGALTFHIDGRSEHVTAGSCVFLPRGTEHGYTILSGRAHLLVILAPGGAEGYLATLHDPDRARLATVDDEPGEAIERLIALAARHGIDIAGPPPGPA
jgi:quercetin dioxygenase-like cupin family protein